MTSSREVLGTGGRGGRHRETEKESGNVAQREPFAWRERESGKRTEGLRCAVSQKQEQRDRKVKGEEMDALSMEAFERRAKEAEDRLSRLETKVASKSDGGMSEEQLSGIMSVLYEVRGALGQEKNQQMLNQRKQSSLEKQILKVSSSLHFLSVWI